ncbi:MAG: hypothetical protein ACM3KM_01200 [Acidobacteriaceae bacterium]
MRNKKLKLAGFFLLICLISANFAFAKTETTKPVLDKLKLSQSAGQSASADQEAKVLKAKAAAVAKMMQNQISRSDSALERMSAIYTKIETRKEKMDEQGLDTSSLTPLMEKAMTQKEKVAGMLETATTKLQAVKTSAQPRKAAQEFLTANKDLKKALIELHQNLKDIVKAMIAIEKQAKAETNSATETTGGQENVNE